MLLNLLTLGLCALVPFLFGFVWYHPKIFGGERWAAAANLTKEAANAQVPLSKLLITILLNFLVAFGLYNVVLHQSHLIGMTGCDLAAIKTGTAAAFIQEYGHTHQHFGHGILHGLAPTLLCFFIPLLGYTVIFERKKIAYLLIRGGFWAVNLALMGGLICKYGGTTIV